VTTANLAFCLARQPDIRTIAFDFDLRRIGLTKALGQRPDHNMADVLEGRVPFHDHALRYDNGLAFGLNNGPVRHSSEILQGRKTAEILDAIEEEFEPDIMLFDLPPIRRLRPDRRWRRKDRPRQDRRG
jgi:MinD-like ATPase involved in chromosome partitioning or flagellar assembly